MVPTSMLLVIVFVSIMVSGIVNFHIGRIVERKRHEVKINVFDAYSDSDLDKERRVTAETVRRHHGSTHFRNTFERATLYLARIDKEIARRKVLTQSNISQTMRELEAFDTVFNALEAKPKEKK